MPTETLPTDTRSLVMDIPVSLSVELGQTQSPAAKLFS